MRRSVFFAALLLLAFCNMAIGLMVRTGGLALAIGGGLPHATNNADLQATASGFAAVIMRDGFAIAGDAPELKFKSSNSACSLNAGAGDNGSQVQSADGKCWLAVFGPSDRVLEQWGCDPTGSADSRACIMAAIAASYSTTTCNKVWFTGRYKIAGTAGLVLGNGSNAAESTLGCTPTLSGTSSPLSWTSNGTTHAPTAPAIFSTSVTDAMIRVKGPLSAWGVQNLTIDCTGNASPPRALDVISAQHGDSKNLTMLACMAGIYSATVSAIPAGLNNVDAISNVYKHLVIQSANANGAFGMVLTGDGNAVPLSDTDMGEIEDVVFVPGCTGGNVCFPLYIQVADSNLIKNWLSTGGATAANIKITFDYSVSTSFPSANTLMHIDNANYTWINSSAPAGGLATNNIIGLLKANGSTNPGLAGLACTAC